MREIKFRLIRNSKIVGYEKHTLSTITSPISGLRKGEVWIGHSYDGKFWWNVSEKTGILIPHSDKNQSTGLFDKFAHAKYGYKEIWDGNILQDGQGVIYKVFWHPSGYWAVISVLGGEPHQLLGSFLELRGGIVIGNLYENSDLIT